MEKSVLDAKALLLERRRELSRLRVAHGEEEHALASLEEGDWPDRAALHAGNDVLHRLTDHDGFELAEVDAALARFAEGCYGSCETCGMPIPCERLRAMPEARRCIACETPSSSHAHPQLQVPALREFTTGSARSRKRG
jgi:DnaK suppressor protein